MPFKVEDFRVNSVDPAKVDQNRFSLRDKPLYQLVFLGGLVASLALMLSALLGSLLTRTFKRKWVWAIVSLVGIPVFVMNWSTGAWTTVLSLGLINTGVTKGLSPVDPWVIKFQLPLGAIVTLLQLLRRRATRDQNP